MFCNATRQSRYNVYPITESEAHEAIAWQYAPPQNFYNLDPTPSQQAQHLAYYLNPKHQIYSVTNSAIRAGARGYLLKDAGKDQVFRSIRGVHNSKVLFGPQMADKFKPRLGQR
ncbi:MAG: hypothetical protein KGS46_11305 [Chloroflexi bacterium]|nr:hypothetical protein [Chloroflexota bacterium]